MDAPLFRDFFGLPRVTKGYVCLSLILSIFNSLDVISPYSLYFDHMAIYSRVEWWRCFTAFTFYGPLGINSLLSIMFVSRYSKMLEEQLFYNNPLDYLALVLISSSMIMIMVAASPIKSLEMLFLGYSLGISLMYYWARLNPEFRFSFFGIINFSAPYLPWVILIFSKIFSGECMSNFIGILVGHLLYFIDHRLTKKKSIKKLHEYIELIAQEVEQDEVSN